MFSSLDVRIPGRPLTDSFDPFILCNLYVHIPLLYPSYFTPYFHGDLASETPIREPTFLPTSDTST